MPFADVAGLLETAVWAPSPHNAQPWRFTYLATKAKARLGEAMGTRLRSDLAAGGVERLAAEEQVRRSVARVSSTG